MCHFSEGLTRASVGSEGVERGKGGREAGKRKVKVEEMAAEELPHMESKKLK